MKIEKLFAPLISLIIFIYTSYIFSLGAYTLFRLDKEKKHLSMEGYLFFGIILICFMLISGYFVFKLLKETFK